MKTVCPWCYLPDCFGKCNTVFKAFKRWSKSDKFMQLFKITIQEPDMEWVSIDGSHVRAHQSSTSDGCADYQGIAKSAGGNSSKINLAVDSMATLWIS